MSNTITNNVLDQMRCSICKGFLSCSPIRSLPDGSCICGRCTPTNSDISVNRALPLEILLSQLSFPCQFKEGGCTESVLFDQASNHESKCMYRSFACPSLKSCDWQGFPSEIHNHFKEHHSELVKKNVDFKLNIKEDADNVFIVEHDKDVIFIIKYSYNVYENCLKYVIRYFSHTRKNEGTFKIQLINDSDTEYNSNLKTNKCFIFDNSFYDEQKVRSLNINKYLEILDNSSIIKVKINLKIVELDN